MYSFYRNNLLNLIFIFKELKYRTEDLKQSLAIWRNILLPLNNLLEWEHQYDPIVIFGIITFIFM